MTDDNIGFVEEVGDGNEISRTEIYAVQEMWEILQTDFGGDETVNFGPRKEAGTALFQIDTIATLSCQDELNTVLPTITSSVLGDLTCFAVDRSLVMKSTSLLSFEKEIDDMEWSPDGQFLVVGDSDGKLCILCGEMAEFLFSFPLIEESRKIGGKAFKRILFSGKGALIVLTADGELIVLEDLEVLKKGSNIMELIKEKSCTVQTSGYQSTICDVIAQGDYIYTVGGSEYIICKWQLQHSNIELIDGVESVLEKDAIIYHGCGTTDGNFLFLSDSNGHISVWNTTALICVDQYTETKLSNFCLLETQTSQNNSLEGMKLALITNSQNGHCNLNVFALPKWESVYNLQLIAPSKFAKCNTMQDDLYVTEVCGDDKDQSFSTVRFRCLKETDPKTRLYRILQKNRFEEAVMFANLFKLNIELVHKVKCNYLLNELSPWNVGKYDKETMEDMAAQLWSCLDKIDDHMHAAESCMKASLPTLPETEALQMYCKTRLGKVDSKDSTVREKVDFLKSELLQIQHKLMTFKMAFGENVYSSEKWEKFVHADLLQESLRLMQEGQLNTGFIIWSQHQAEWTNGEITPELIQQILANIPYTTSSMQLCGYLSAGLLPVVVREVPMALRNFIDFVIEKAKSMEVTDKKAWPESAIRFCDFLTKRICESIDVSMDDDTCMASETADKTKYKCMSMLEPLNVFRMSLQQLYNVIHKYKCHMSLAQFLQETRETIAFRMLDKVHAIQLIVPTLEKEIRPYMREHGLNQDLIFSKYIKDLMERQGQIRTYTGEVTWGAKCVAIIDCISDAEQKIEGIMEVMKWAPVPWSAEIDNLVQMGLKIKHNAVTKLKVQCERVHVRKLLMKYGNQNIEVPLSQEAEQLACVMLKQDRPGCMEDALEVMRFCGVKAERRLYGFRMRELIYTDKLEECLDLLKTLPVQLGLSVGNDILTYTSVMLNFTDDIHGLEEKTRAEKKLFTEAAIHINKYLQSKEQVLTEVKELKHQQKVLKNILSLQKEYEMYPSLSQYEDEECKMKIMFQFTKDFFANKKQAQILTLSLKNMLKCLQDKMQMLNTSYVRLYRLASLLQIPHTILQGQMAIRQANAGDINTAVEICSELYKSNPTTDTAETLYEVASSFLTMQAEVDVESEDIDTNKLRVLPELCYRLANQAVTICSPDKLCQYLELARACSQLLLVSQQCESGDSCLSTQWDEGTTMCTVKGQEMIRDLSLDLFEEDTLLMTSTIALPLVANYLDQCPFMDLKQEKAVDAVDEVVEEDGAPQHMYMAQCTKVIPIVQHLRDNGHIQLAFSFSLSMLHNLLRHVHQQDIGLPIVNERKEAVIQENQKYFIQINSNSQSLLKDLVHTIVMKICNASKLDAKLALTYLAMLPKRDILDIMKRLIKAAGHQYKKLKSVAGLGIALGELFKEVPLIDTCRQLETNAHWGYRLSKIKVCFKDYLHGHSGEKQKLLPMIAKSELADTELVKEFCQAFQLDQDAGLLMYLDSLFTIQDDMSFSSSFNKHSMLLKVKEAVREIRNQDDLMSKIRAVYYRTSSYDYETLEVLFDVLKTGENENIPVEKGFKLLGYLKVYARHSKPTDYEFEYRSSGEKKESHVFIGSLPEESKNRLPLHPILHGDAWKIISAELNKDSIKEWLIIARLLDLSPDQICMTAVQNMVKNYKDSFSKMDGGSDLSLWHWNQEQANVALLQEAKEVLENIKNCESFLACGKWMVKNLPLGSEKVMVLDQCIRYAELWHLSIPEGNPKKEKAKAAYVKFLSHWEKMSSAKTLCLHGLGEAELLQMTEKPAKLIQALYEHPSIGVLEWENKTTKPDIHGAVEELAQINSIQLGTIQRSMLQKWLQTSASNQQESDETMTFSLDSLKLSEAFVKAEDDEDVYFKRIVHLMERGCLKDNILILLNYGYTEGQDAARSIRALRCLLHIADEATLKSACDKSLDDIRDHMYVMMYIAGLEKLHINHTVATFMACQKESLVKGIWKKHSHEKKAACIVSSLCLDYKIFDQQLWSSLLQRLYSFGLMKQLELVLLRLNGVPELWQIQPFVKMWNIVITFQLSKVCPPLTPEQTYTCVHYFNLLMSCPVLKELDCPGISRLFLKLKLYGCALGCLLVCRSEEEESVLEFIQCKSKEILTSLSELQCSGFQYGLSQKIKETVFKYIISAEKFELIMGSPDQADFEQYCVIKRSIDGLLKYGIQNKKLKESKQLIGLYCHTYADVNMKLSRYIDDDDEEEEEDKDPSLTLLKAYLKMQNIKDVFGLIDEEKDLEQETAKNSTF